VIHNHRSNGNCVVCGSERCILRPIARLRVGRRFRYPMSRSPLARYFTLQRRCLKTDIAFLKPDVETRRRSSFEIRRRFWKYTSLSKTDVGSQKPHRFEHRRRFWKTTSLWKPTSILKNNIALKTDVGFEKLHRFENRRRFWKTTSRINSRGRGLLHLSFTPTKHRCVFVIKPTMDRLVRHIACPYAPNRDSAPSSWEKFETLSYASFLSRPCWGGRTKDAAHNNAAILLPNLCKELPTGFDVFFPGGFVGPSFLFKLPL